MIKDALQWIQDLDGTGVKEIHGMPYHVSSGRATPVNVPHPKTIELSSLASLCDLVKSDGGKAISFIHVHSSQSVCVYSGLDKCHQRHAIAEATTRLLPRPFTFDEWYQIEALNIGLQTQFIPTESLKAVREVIASVTTGAVHEFVDDGVHQQVTMKSGNIKTNGVLNPTYVLKPYRTFLDVDQPESEFIFRAKGRDEKTPLFALFRADGGRWEHEAMKNIAEFIKTNTEGKIPIYV